MAIVVQPAMEAAAKKKSPTKQRRVVVTGMGVFYNNLLEGVSGISEIEASDCSQYPTKIAGEIKTFLTDGWVAPKLSERMDRFMLYMLTAAKKALVDSGITEEVMNELDQTRCGVLIGSAMGGMKDMMLCGGSDAAIIPIGLGDFVACKALSQRNSDPTKASCPWDAII